MIPDHIICKLNSEYARSLQLHPHREWQEFNLYSMLIAVRNEFIEICQACHVEDIHGTHGAKAEALQTAVTALRMYGELERRG